jgi:hypothetical protein
MVKGVRKMVSGKAAIAKIKLNSPRGKAMELENKAADSLRDGLENKAKGLMDRAVTAAQKGDSLAYVAQVKGRRDDVYSGNQNLIAYVDNRRKRADRGEDIYADEASNTFKYSLALVAFSLGGLLLLGNITGNVVGLGDAGSSVLGAILFAAGVVGVLVLVRDR